MRILILLIGFISIQLFARISSSATSYSSSYEVTTVIPSSSGSSGSSRGSGGHSSTHHTTSSHHHTSSGSGGGYTPPSPPPPPLVQINLSDYAISNEEDAKNGYNMKFNISFSRALGSDITLNYKISTDNIDSKYAITLGKDIKESANNSIILKKGDKNAEINIHVIDDDIKENAEYFNLILETPSSSANRFSMINGTSMGIILDNDKDIDQNSSSGSYAIFEHGNTNTNIDTKIVNSVIKLDIQGKAKEILHDIRSNTSRSCVDAGCYESVEHGVTVKHCRKNCTTTVTTYYDYRDSMNIKKVVMHRFKGYNPSSKKCTLEDTPLTLINDAKLSSGETLTLNIPSNKAYRCAYIEVYGVSATQYTEKVPLVYKGKSDLFAIRPEKFDVEAPAKLTSATPFELKVKALPATLQSQSSYSNTKYIKGEDDLGNKVYNFFYSFFHKKDKKDENSTKATKVSVKVVGGEIDYFSNISKNYNQLNNTTFSIKPSDQIYHESNISNLGFDLSGFKFSDGSWSKNINYKEVGKVDINISENPSNYFAMVDNSNSFIKPFSKTIEFVADKFIVDDYTSKYKSHDLAFDSNNLQNVTAYVNLDIKAVNADGDIVKRYTKNGYAKDTTLTLTQSINTTDNIASGKRELKTEGVANLTKFNVDGTDAITVRNFTKDDFLDGKLHTNKIYQTFTRVDNQAINPIKLATKKVKLEESLTSTIKGEKSKNDQTSDFYYVRAHVAPDPITVAGNDLKATVYYETYCKGCDKSKFVYANQKASIDSVYWYILPNGSYDSSTCDINSNPTASDMSIVDTLQRVDFKTLHLKVKKSPSTNRVFYTPSFSYLLYDRYKTPVVNHKFDVRFTSAGAKWAGEGNLGNTVDTKISHIKNNSLED